MNVLDLILSKDWLWGAVAGFASKALADLIADRKRLSHEHRVAALCVASDLCAWLDQTRLDFYSMQNRQVPDGEQDCAMDTLHPFPFERSLGQVALLPKKHARAIFRLIRARSDANISIDHLAEYGDPEELPDAYLKHAAQVSLKANGIYERIAKTINLRDEALTPQFIKTMQGEIVRVEAAESASVKANAALFLHIKPDERIN